MSNSPEQTGPAEKPKKPALPPSRIAVLIFVAVAAVVIVLELRARMAFNSSYEAIDAAMINAEQTGKSFYRKDVGQLLSGSPTREADQDNSELLTWHGILQTYRIRVYFGAGDFVQRIQTE